MKFRTNENGSITLEAALVLPLFLAFVLCLMTIIKLTIVQMSLQNATSEMTKQVATHNLLSTASDELKQIVKEQTLDPVQDANESLDAYTQRVEEQVKSRLTQAFNNAIRPGFQLNHKK
ncbi:pilus assembly protein [Paenibacillus athensensis]|uniref:TadE/TadG family type IV pilus assembly protein n=1 Tax=Paenibacillus athensensis TaxID=1967502 RepID=UPI001E4257E5|nr:TadE family protein [Paenibacillus athensensis]MCD1260383.1 pilus assembly protein [Paenibacillus athensensis]